MAATESLPPPPPVGGPDTKIVPISPNVERWGRSAPPTAAEARAANAHELAPRGIGGFVGRMASNWPLRLAVGGVGAVAAYQNVPAFHQFVDTQYHNILDRLGVEVRVPSAFDSKADKAVVGDNNAIPLSLDEINEQFPKQYVDSEGKTLSLLFPFKLPEGAQTQYERNYFKANTDFDLPKGAEIIAPITGHVFLGSFSEEKDPELAAQIKMIFYDPGKNITYAIDFGATGLGSGVNIFEPIEQHVSTSGNLIHETSRTDTGIEQNIYRYDRPSDEISWTGTDWEKLPVVERGTSIAKLPRDRKVRMISQAFNGKVTGPDGDITYKNGSALAPRFITTSESGIEKIVVLED